jgi:hypothetical protein
MDGFFHGSLLNGTGERPSSSGLSSNPLANAAARSVEEAVSLTETGALMTLRHPLVIGSGQFNP